LYDLYAITWYDNVARLRGGEIMAVGICKYSGKIAMFSIRRQSDVPLHIIMVHDVVVEGDRCEEAKRCIALSCPLNKASLRYFSKRGVRTEEELEKLHALMERIRKDLDLKAGKWGVVHIFGEAPVRFGE